MSVTTESIPITSFATLIIAPVQMLSANFSLAFLICTKIVKNLLKTKRSKKKKHNKIPMLTRSILNSISEELKNNEISHEDSMTVVRNR